MYVKSKKITLLVLVVVIIAIALLGGCEKFEEPRPVSLDDRPMIAYMKEEYKKRDGVVYSLKISTFAGDSQIVAMRCLGLSAGAQGSIIGFKLERGDAYHNDLYFLNRSGESRLVAENITSYEQSKNGYSFCVSQPQNDELIYRKYSSEGDLLREAFIEGEEDIFSWELSSNGDIILYEEDVAGASYWNDFSIYIDGQMTKVAEMAALSKYDQSISNDGMLLYLSDGVSEEYEDPIGTLYRKEPEGEAEKVMEASTRKFAISNDGELIASIVLDGDGNESLFYQYAGQEPIFVENIVQFEMSRDSNILYYLAGDKTDWQLELFRVSMGEEPVKITDNVAKIGDISEDGKSVAYVANYDGEEHRAELYIAREGEQIEFVISDIFIFEIVNSLSTIPSKLYYDGTAIAYKKGISDESGKFIGLFVKEQGKVPIRIDDGYIIDFDFLK